MSNDKDKKLNAEDRFTTQDINEIDQLINDTSFSDFPAEEASSVQTDSEKPKEEKVAEEVSAEPVKPVENENKVEKTEKENPINTVETQSTEKAKDKELETKVEKSNDGKAKTSSVKSVKPKTEKKTPLNSKKSDGVKKSFSIFNSEKTKPKGLPRKKNPHRWKKTLSIFVAIVAILGIIGVSGVYLLYTANFTDISNTKYTPKESTEIYTADNVLIATLYSENRKYISIEQVPQDLINALVATEDSRFYSHNGVDYIGVLRALLSNVIYGNSTGQGASTITQQLARLLYLPDIASESTFMDSLNRKFKEISISYQLEDKYTKDQIMEVYLNEYYFGSGAYGIEAAANTYFGKSVSDLTLAEAALLAGLPQAPSAYAPNTNIEAAKNRQRQVLERMEAAGYITEEQVEAAYNEPLNIVPWSPNDINNQITPGYQNFVAQVITSYANAVAPSIMKERGLSQEEAEDYARATIASGGFKIYTTILDSYQQTAINTMESRLLAYGYYQDEGYTGALVSVDQDGAVRAYYGGNEEYSDIDMASSPRQPGSNIKPLYYALGVEEGLYGPSTTVYDQPINIGGYSPRNFDNAYRGAMSFTQSLVQSRNVTSVQIFNRLGTQTAVDYIKSFGFDSITDDDYNLAVSLGGLTYGIKPYQMAAAFNTFNDNGVYNQAYFFTRITTSNGDLVLDKNQLGLVSTPLMSQQTANTMWSIMQQVVTSGTGTAAACGLPTAGKTGTTDNNENLWFTGMTSNITTSVWLGHLDYYVIGGSSAIPAGIYGTYMRSLINNGLIS